MTKEEAKRIKSPIADWFSAYETSQYLPYVKEHIGHLKIAFMWGFHYLREGMTYEDAMYDILGYGGDTDTNACIIGGLLGAA